MPAAPASRPAARIGGILIFAALYVAAAALATFLAIGAYTPCVPNFEGGCGMAKGLAALVSLVPAGGAAVFGIVLVKLLGEHPAIARKIGAWLPMAHLLWLAPLGYILFTLFVLF